MINITPSRELTKIYLVTNCYGDPNKVYIGQTRKSRKSPHQLIYGKNITYDYIDQVESYNKEDWKPLETFWINYFKFLGFEVLNKNEGGGGPIFLSPSTIEKMKINSIGKGIKPIIQYDLKGNFIKEWPSIKEASIILKISSSNIGRCCCGNGLSYKGNLWRFKENPLSDDFKMLRQGYKPIIQYNLNNEFIKEWNSIKEAELFYSGKLNKNISACINKRQKTAYNFKWELKLPSNNKITQLTLDGNLIKEWDNYKEIGKEFLKNKNTGNIITCCNGNLKSAYGFIWKYSNLRNIF